MESVDVRVFAVRKAQCHPHDGRRSFDIHGVRLGSFFFFRNSFPDALLCTDKLSPRVQAQVLSCVYGVMGVYHYLPTLNLNKSNSNKTLKVTASLSKE